MAAYLDKADELYSLTIKASEGGTIPAGMDSEIGGRYHVDDVVSILSRPMPDHVFDKWVTKDGGKFFDEKSPTTKFVMPMHNTTIIATFKY